MINETERISREREPYLPGGMKKPPDPPPSPFHNLFLRFLQEPKLTLWLTLCQLQRVNLSFAIDESDQFLSNHLAFVVVNFFYLLKFAKSLYASMNQKPFMSNPFIIEKIVSNFRDLLHILRYLKRFTRLTFSSTFDLKT